MKISPRVLIDNCVLIEGSLNIKNYRSDFFEYIISNPDLGLITESMRKGSESRLNKILTREKPKRKDKVLRRFQNITNSLRIETIGYNQKRKKLYFVNSFLTGIKEGSYRVEVFNWEDRLVLAEALCLKERYSPLFLTSYDEHFLSLSDEIKEELDIKCDTPSNVLRELKQY